MTADDPLLMIPGPTNLPPEVREALAGPSIYHRGDDFSRLLERCSEGLRALLETSDDVLLLTSSGTGAVEAAVTNFLSPGDRVVAVQAGKFGERMGDIAEAFGAEVVRLEFDYGTAATPEAVSVPPAWPQPPSPRARHVPWPRAPRGRPAGPQTGRRRPV